MRLASESSQVSENYVNALNEAQRTRLIEKLKKLTGKEIVVKEKIDPSVLGGVLLQMDGKRYDNTVRHRLAAIKQTMTEE